MVLDQSRMGGPGQRAGLVLALGLGAFGHLLGCGGGETEGNTPSEGSTPTAESTPSPTPTAAPGTIRVSVDGSGDYPSLREAVKAAKSGDTIIVDPGTYVGSIDFETKSLIIESSGSPVDTILEAEPCTEDTSRCAVVTIAGGQGDETQLRGFTLRGGGGNLCDETVAPSLSAGAPRCGGGIYVYGASPVLGELIVLGNEADFGGGAALGGEGAAPALEGVQLVDNEADRGGGLYHQDVDLDATHLRVVDNNALILGGGIHGAGGSLNLAGALVVGNSAVLGGGSHFEEIDVGCRFTSLGGNGASGAGGGINLGDGADLYAYGVILGANDAPQGEAINLGCGSCSAILEYVHLEGGTEALGGAWSSFLELKEWQEGDPAFLGDGDYRLGENSPCGDAIPLSEGVLDPDGSRADLGAYGSPLAGLWDLDGDGAYYDWKGEGSQSPGAQWDCDDLDADARPGATEICDGKDTNCDGALLQGEEDQDGDGALLCGEDDDALDCDDEDGTAYPGGDEGVDGDGADNDCDGTADESTLGRDDDGDGYCEGNAGSGTCTDGSIPGDCDDDRPWLAPGLEEQCDGLDNDCDGSVDSDELDGDEDGFPPCAGDENDNNDSIYPGAPEQANGIDDDLDDIVDENTVYSDDDGDGVCESMGPGCNAAGDCDDTDPDIRPGVAERCDGVDTDCSGAPMDDEVDEDGDGYMICEGDCADGARGTNPGALDIEGNGIDEDCDGWDRGAVGFSLGDDNDTRGLTLSCDTQGQGQLPGAALVLVMLSLLRPWIRRPRVEGKGGRGQGALLPLLLLVGLAQGVGCSDAGDLADETTTAASTGSPASTSTPTATPLPTASSTPTAESPTSVESPTETATESPDLIVAQDGSGDTLTISEAFRLAEYGSTIRVREGVYEESLELGAKSILIEAMGAPERTIIDASSCPGGLCVPIIIRGAGGARTEIEGFTLTGGMGLPCDEAGAFLSTEAKGETCGGGLYLWNATVTLGHVIIRGNEASRGGGLFIGGAEDGPSGATIRNLRVLQNGGDEGAGVMLSNAYVNGTWWEVGDNTSTGLGGGISLVRGASLTLGSSIIAQNRAPIGAGISLTDSALLLNYVAVTGGHAQWGGGVSVGENGDLEGEGNIFADNDADQGASLNLSCESCRVSLAYSLIQGGASDIGGGSGSLIMASAGMLAGDPLFAEGGWHLSSGSPAIDQGPPLERDIDGTRADMGPYGGERGGAWDLDGDGSAQGQYGAGGDCDDGDGGKSPDSAEVCDGLDNDCDGEIAQEEADEDGDGVRLCDLLPDCDDDAPEAYPGAIEGAEGDGLDNDCDGEVDELTTGRDDDGDGQCEGAEPLGGGCSDGSVPGDCDDLDPDRSGLNEEVCDGLDSDCDGQVAGDEFDLDEDGYRPCDGDQDDRNDAIYPGAPEEPQGVPDGLDNDQDGLVDENTRAADDDGDGYCEDLYQCAGGLPGGDCDDGDPLVHPGAEEICDGRDTDCADGLDLGEVDGDGDGFTRCAGDCDDDNPHIHPQADDAPQDGIDQDCNGVDKGIVGFAEAGENGSESVTLSCDGAGAQGLPLSTYAFLLLGILGRPKPIDPVPQRS